MCGRYTLTSAAGEIDDRFGARLPGLALERYNVAPTETVAVVTTTGRGAPREARGLRWGIDPPWRKGGPLINARAETVATRHPFKALVGRPQGRCLIVADGFYEWLRAEDRRTPRQPFHFHLRDREPFAFAGLHDGEAATILTCAPNRLVARLHDRMPVILAGSEAEEAWLTADLTADDLPVLCATLDAGRMASHPVSSVVNRSGLEDEGPHLLRAERAGPDQASLF